ncbi:hypothetical protein ACWER6_17945 [Streptomyces sp. NPDC004009]
MSASKRAKSAPQAGIFPFDVLKRLDSSAFPKGKPRSQAELVIAYSFSESMSDIPRIAI